MTGVVQLDVKHGTIQAQRPYALQKIFLGRTPAQVVQLVGLSYSLCGVAQQFTASLALATAQAQLDDFQITSGLDAVRWETLREHLMSLTQLAVRLQVIPESEQAPWLQGMGQWTKPSLSDQQKQEQLRQLMQRWDGDTFFQACSSASTTADFEAALERVRSSQGTIGQLLKAIEPLEKQLVSAFQTLMPVPQVHQLKASEMRIMLSQDWGIWAESPVLSGQTFENSVLGRMSLYYPNLLAFSRQAPLSARVLARWLEMSALCEQSIDAMELYGFHTTSEGAMAWVETARGRLWHFALCDEAQVQRYAISAPTEWNFHPDGHFAQWAKQLHQELDTASWITAMKVIAQVVDPCVPLKFKTVKE